jgi:hypothetical protein
LPYVLDLSLLYESARHDMALVEFLSRDLAQILSCWHRPDHFLVGAGD